MTSTVVDRWVEVIHSGRTELLTELLADDAVFYSPAVFSPQSGKDKTRAYLDAAMKMFADTGFHYTEIWSGDGSAVLEFAATVDGLHVEGVDIIHWNADDKIVRVKVMIRPLKALQSVVPLMGALLQHDEGAAPGAARG